MTEGKLQTAEPLLENPWVDIFRSCISRKNRSMSWAATFFKTLLSYLFIILLTACHAHYPVNQSITSVDAIENYSLEKESEESASERSEELLLILTFSGGGTRAAGFSYGILEALADTEIMIDGKRRRLVDEIDVISSVSGGSFTAAYFGLFGDRIFEDFETKFLKFNVQGELFGRMLSPLAGRSWPRFFTSVVNWQPTITMNCCSRTKHSGTF